MKPLLFLTLCILHLNSLGQSPYKLQLKGIGPLDIGQFNIQFTRDTGFTEVFNELYYTIFHIDENKTITSIYPHLELSSDWINGYINSTSQDTFTHPNTTLQIAPSNSTHTFITVFCEEPVWVIDEEYLTRGVGGRPPYLYSEELLDIITGNPNKALGLLFFTSTTFTY
ncbi:MAG: hypothetical protein JXR19_03340 [Bacteroidia bacterium]